MTYEEKIKDKELSKKHGIYCLLVNNEAYVGSAVDLRKRLMSHLNNLKAGKHVNNHLQRAFNKYSQIDFKILEIIETPSLLIEREQYFIDSITPRYNIAPIAGSMLGFKHSEITKEKISKVQLGRKLSESVKEKMSLYKIGVRLSESHIKNISLSKMGDKNPFYKAGVNHPQYGKKRSYSTICKLSGDNSNLSKTGVLYDVENNCNYVFRSLRSICKRLNLNYYGVKNAVKGNRFYMNKWYGDFISIPLGIETKILTEK